MLTIQTRLRSTTVAFLFAILVCMVTSQSTQTTQSTDITCPRVADICLILDDSTSIISEAPGYLNWYGSIIGFATQLTNSFPIASNLTQVGVVRFSNTATVPISLNTYNNAPDLVDAITTLAFLGGETNIAAALDAARSMLTDPNQGARQGIPKIAILITDGTANLDVGRTQISANQTKAAGIVIFTVGITTKVDVIQLKAIASPPSDSHYFFVSDYKLISTILSSLVENSCKFAATLPTTPTTTTPSPTSPSTSSITTATLSLTTTTMAGGHNPEGPCRKKADVAFIVDCTSNLAYTNYVQYVLGFMQSIVLNLDNTGRVQVAAISFSDNAMMEFYFNNYTQMFDVASALGRVRYGGDVANQAAALSLALSAVFQSSNGARLNDPTVNRLVVVLTSNSSTNTAATLAAASALNQAGIGVVTIGIGSLVNLYELSAAASYPSSNYSFVVPYSRNLSTISDNVKRIICSDDGACQPGVCANGGACSERLNGVVCQCTAPYTGRLCENSCVAGSDVIFALDSSGTVTYNNFQLMLSFVASVVQSLNIDGPSNSATTSRVGLVTFGNSVTQNFYLNSYSTKADTLKALTVPYINGRNNLAAAIQMSRTVMFQQTNGDRPNVPSYLVLVVGSESSNLTQAWIEAMNARNNGINILVVGVGNQIDYADVASALVTSPSSANSISVTDYYSLNNDDAVSRVTSSLCNNVNDCSRSQCLNGAQCVETLNSYTCSPCPIGFFGSTCGRACSGVIDLVFVLDSAGTVHAERWHFMADFVESIVTRLDIGPTRTRVGVIYYSDQAYLGFSLNAYYATQDIIQATRFLPYIGAQANVAAALQLLIQTLNAVVRPSAQRVAVLIINGKSTIDADKVTSLAASCRINGIQMITIVADSTLANSPEAMAITSEPLSRNMFVTPTLSRVLNASDGVLNALCNDQNFCSPNPCQNGGSCHIDVGRYYCTCTRGFAGYNCTTTCSKQVDMIIIIDSSTSVADNVIAFIDLARKIVHGLDVENGLAQVGAVAFSDVVNDEFYLNSYPRSRESVVTALAFYNYGGTTNTSGALNEVRLNMFTTANGARSGVDKVAILITDGYSTVNVNQTLLSAVALRNSGVKLYAVAAGSSPQLSELQPMVSSPTSNYLLLLPDSSSTDSVTQTLTSRICSS